MRCLYCESTRHSTRLCPQMAEDLQTGQDNRPKAGAVIWSEWMLCHPWVVGRPVTDEDVIGVAA